MFFSWRVESRNCTFSSTILALSSCFFDLSSSLVILSNLVKSLCIIITVINKNGFFLSVWMIFYRVISRALGMCVWYLMENITFFNIRILDFHMIHDIKSFIFAYKQSHVLPNNIEHDHRYYNEGDDGYDELPSWFLINTPITMTTIIMTIDKQMNRKIFFWNINKTNNKIKYQNKTVTKIKVNWAVNIVFEKEIKFKRETI